GSFAAVIGAPGTIQSRVGARTKEIAITPRARWIVCGPKLEAVAFDVGLPTADMERIVHQLWTTVGGVYDRAFSGNPRNRRGHRRAYRLIAFGDHHFRGFDSHGYDVSFFQLQLIGAFARYDGFNQTLADADGNVRHHVPEYDFSNLAFQ